MFDGVCVCQAPPPTVIKAGFVNHLDFRASPTANYTLHLSVTALLVGPGGSSQRETMTEPANYQDSQASTFHGGESELILSK